MELRKKNLHMLRKKCEAENQLTLDEDFNVPDHKEDIGQVIQKKGEIQIDEVQVSENKAVIVGHLVFRLLYVADSPGRAVCSLEGKLPLEEVLHLEEVQGGDKVNIKWEMEDLTIHTINSRKLNIKAIVEFDGVVEVDVQVPVPIELKEENEVSTKKKTIRVLTLGVHKKDTLRKKEEIVLPADKPNIHEVLWSDVQVRGMELRAQEGKVSARGELFVFVLYRTDDTENPLQWIEQTLSFMGEMMCTGCTMDMIPYIETTMVQTNLEVKPDADGEERVLLADVILEFDVKLYQEETHSIVYDVYTPKKECIPQRKTEVLEQLLIKNTAKCRVHDRVALGEPQGKILQICHSDGKVKVDTIQPVSHGILVEGIVQVQILYSISDDERPFYAAETVLPFSHVIEGEQVGESCAYQLQADLEQLSTVMLDSSEVEVKAVLNLNALLFEKWEEDVISQIEEKELDPKKIEEMPGIICYVVQPQETLWDIARMFYTTTEAIRKLNDLGEGEVKPQQTLLIVKNAE